MMRQAGHGSCLPCMRAAKVGTKRGWRDHSQLLPVQEVTSQVTHMHSISHIHRWSLGALLI